MPKTNHQRALTIIIFTALAVAVGCGDGSKRKQAIRPSKLTQSDKGGTKASGASAGTGAAGNAGDTTGNSGVPNLPAQSDADKASAVNIASQIAAEKQGTLIQNFNELEEGTYTLTSIATHFKYSATNSAENFVKSELQSSGSGQILTLISQDAIGAFTNGDSGRSVVFPISFAIDLTKGPWRPTDEGNTQMLKSQVVQDNKTMKLTSNDRLDDKSIIGSNDLSMMTALADGPRNDASGRAVAPAIYKQADGSINVVIGADEFKTGSTPAVGEGQTSREFFFNYKLEKKPESSPLPEPDTTPASADSVPASADSAQSSADSVPTTN